MNELDKKFLLRLNSLSDINNEAFLSLQREFCKEYKISFIQKDKLVNAYFELVQSNIIAKNKRIENILKLKSTRSLSGIVVVSVLTKPYPCPNNCLYCPTQSGIPKSYLEKEPAVARAIMCGYSPYKQVMTRLHALKNVGHITNKINIRIIGGTWSYYSHNYQTFFVKELFRACNEFEAVDPENALPKTLPELQSINERANGRIVEISIETRPDYINLEEVKRLRKLGVTKVELGVQSIYDSVLRLNNRGHLVESTILATKLLKDYGFKVSYQMMVNLPGSDPDQDLSMFKTLFSDERFCPDHLKIYPLALVKEADLYKLYQQKKFKPYNEQELTDLLARVKSVILPYCRIERVIRDIPADYIVEGGAKISNLRQKVLYALETRKVKCQCIRCREIKSEKLNGKETLIIDEYKASDGKEFFLNFETETGKLASMLRLRLPDSRGKVEFECLKNSALIREIHTYGMQVEIGTKDENATQHQGLGKRLIKKAEEIAQANGYDKMAVIAGVGVRGYFAKLGYKLQETYMVKDL